MSGRRDIVLGLAVMAALPLAGSAGANAAPVGEAEALEALLPWIEAVADGDPAAVERLLAPEFQILRSDGISYDKAGYLAALPEHRLMPAVHDVQATGDRTSLVIRYSVTVDEVVSGEAVRGTAPRLSALRRDSDTWLMVAHANFARIG